MPLLFGVSLATAPNQVSELVQDLGDIAVGFSRDSGRAVIWSLLFLKVREDCLVAFGTDDISDKAVVGLCGSDGFV